MVMDFITPSYMLFFDTYMRWYMNQDKPIRSVCDRLFQNHDLYVSNSKKKVNSVSNPKLHEVASEK